MGHAGAIISGGKGIAGRKKSRSWKTAGIRRRSEPRQMGEPCSKANSKRRKPNARRVLERNRKPKPNRKRTEHGRSVPARRAERQSSIRGCQLNHFQVAIEAKPPRGRSPPRFKNQRRRDQLLTLAETHRDSSTFNGLHARGRCEHFDPDRARSHWFKRDFMLGTRRDCGAVHLPCKRLHTGTMDLGTDSHLDSASIQASIQASTVAS